MEKYKILQELINQWVEREKEKLKELREYEGINSPAVCRAVGALSAYEQVLSDIAELEREAVIS